MKRVGKSAAAITATVVCFAFMFCMAMQPTGAQASDTTPPVTSAAVAGSYNDTTGWYYSSSPVVTLTASDDSSGVAHTYYRLDGGALSTYTAGFTIPDGEHTLTFYSVDNAGNTESLSPSRNYLGIKVDTVAPNVTMRINGKLNNTTGNYAGNTTVNLTATDNRSGISSIQYSFDNATWTIYAGNVTIPDGSSTLYYRSLDNAGNVHWNSTAFKVFYPLILTSPPANTWYPYSLYDIMFVKPMSDDVARIEYSLTSNFKPYYTYDMDSPSPFDLEVQGNRSIWYRAIGRSGDISEVRFIWFGIDRTDATISLQIDGDKSTSKGWYNGDITIHLNVNNPSPATTEYSWDNKNWNTYTGPFKVAWSTSKTIYYRTSDIFGDSDSGSSFIYFRPGQMNQGSMSNSVNINGTLNPGNPSATGTPTEVPTAQPTSIPTATPDVQPTPTETPDTSTGSGDPLAVTILIGVLAFLAIAAAAVYLFMFKPK